MVLSTQGVLELEEGERSKGEGGQGEDVWLQEVQDQIRNGTLSEDNWHFLHGRPTLVPGTWARGTAQCGNEVCIALAEVRAASGAHSEAKLTRPHKRARNKTYKITSWRMNVRDVSTLENRGPVSQPGGTTHPLTTLPSTAPRLSSQQTISSTTPTSDVPNSLLHNDVW